MAGLSLGPCPAGLPEWVEEIFAEEWELVQLSEEIDPLEALRRIEFYAHMDDCAAVLRETRILRHWITNEP